MRRFQLEVQQGNEMELRLVSMQGISREMAFDKAKQALAAFLLEQGVRCAEIRLSPEAPKRQLHSTKFKHIKAFALRLAALGLSYLLRFS